MYTRKTLSSLSVTGIALPAYVDERLFNLALHSATSLITSYLTGSFVTVRQVAKSFLKKGAENYPYNRSTRLADFDAMFPWFLRSLGTASYSTVSSCVKSVMHIHQCFSVITGLPVTEGYFNLKFEGQEESDSLLEVCFVHEESGTSYKVTAAAPAYGAEILELSAILDGAEHVKAIKLEGANRWVEVDPNRKYLAALTSCCYFLISEAQKKGMAHE